MSGDPFNFFKEDDEIKDNDYLKFDPSLDTPIGAEEFGGSDFLTRKIIQKRGFALDQARGAKRKSPKKGESTTKRHNKQKKSPLDQHADELPFDADENVQEEHMSTRSKNKTSKQLPLPPADKQNNRPAKSKNGRAVLRERIGFSEDDDDLSFSSSLYDLGAALYDYNQTSPEGDGSAALIYNTSKPDDDVILIGSTPTPNAGREYERQRATTSRARGRKRATTNTRSTPNDDVILIGSPPTPRAGREYESQMAAMAAQGRGKRNTTHGWGQNQSPTSRRSSRRQTPLNVYDGINTFTEITNGDDLLAAFEALKAGRKIAGVMPAVPPKATSTVHLELDEFDDENPLISVKIRWKHKIEAFKVRKYQKFSNVLKSIAERDGKTVDNFIYILNDNLISPDQSPASTQYKISDVIEMKPYAGTLTAQPHAVEQKKNAPDEITVKIQMDIRKHKPISVTLKKTEKLKMLYIKCAEELEHNIYDFHLSFDGERLEYDDTANDHDMVTGDMIDFCMKKK